VKIWPVAALIAASCGRFDFGAHARDGGAIDGPVDGAADGALPSSLIHQYSLVDSYVDDLGGPSLTGLGGSFITAGYQYGQNQGLSLTGAMPPAVYSVEITFNFSNVTGYNKLIDFKGLTSDAGLYVYDSQLQFVVIPVTGCPGNDCYTSSALFAPDTQATVTITRDAAAQVVGYVGTAAVFTFVDGGSVGEFNSNGNVVNFCIDDTSTTTEASAGTVRRIRIYSAALTAAQVNPP
jgi:hypothetical protein